MDAGLKFLMHTQALNIASLKDNDRYSICLTNGEGEAWFYDFGKPKAQKGDEVRIDFTINEKGGWKNIEEIKLECLNKAAVKYGYRDWDSVVGDINLVWDTNKFDMIFNEGVENFINYK